jgi:hypothetical protein
MMARSRGRSPPRSDTKRPRHPSLGDGRQRCFDDSRAPASHHLVRPNRPLSREPSRERRAGVAGSSFAEREQTRRLQQERMEAEQHHARQQQNQRDGEARQQRQREAEAAECDRQQRRRQQQQDAERQQQQQKQQDAEREQQKQAHAADFEARERQRRLERERAAAAAAAAEAARQKQQEQRGAEAWVKACAAKQQKEREQQEQLSSSVHAQEEHSDVRNNAAAAVSAAVPQHPFDAPDSPLTAPRHWRAPQPLGGSTAMMPGWVEDCFIKDEMAQECERVQGVPFLREGVAPAVGQALYLQVCVCVGGGGRLCMCVRLQPAGLEVAAPVWGGWLRL